MCRSGYGTHVYILTYMSIRTYTGVYVRIYIGVGSLSVYDYMSRVMRKAWFTVRGKALQSLQCNATNCCYEIYMMIIL